MDALIGGLIILLVLILPCHFIFKRPNKTRRIRSNDTLHRNRQPPASPRNHLSAQPAGVFSNDDVLKGFRFHATLSIRTPAAVLEHHGEVLSTLSEQLPQYGSTRDGIWLPEVKSWGQLIAESGGNAELGNRLDAVEDLSACTVATDIGPMPNSGNVYYRFLLGFRHIVDSTSTDEDKSDRLRQFMASNSEFKEYARRHDGDLAKNWKQFVSRAKRRAQ
ncbi:MAG: hypothetical protein ABL970_00945 [Nitrospira sp.]